MGLIITFGIACLLAILPLGVSFCYDEDGVLLCIIAGPLKITLLPRPQKEKKPKKENKAKEKKQKQPKKKTGAKGAQPSASTGDAVKSVEKKKSGGPITDFLPLVKILLKFLNGFRKKLRVNVLELKLIMAADDPCDLAVNYGRAWAAVGNLMPQIERVFTIQKRNIEVECDFSADKTKVLARFDLTITLGRLLSLVFVLIGRAIVELIKIVMKRKGGAVNEPKSS